MLFITTPPGSRAGGDGAPPLVLPLRRGQQDEQGPGDVPQEGKESRQVGPRTATAAPAAAAAAAAAATRDLHSFH